MQKKNKNIKLSESFEMLSFLIHFVWRVRVIFLDIDSGEVEPK